MSGVSPNTLSQMARRFFTGVEMEDWEIIKDLPCGHPFKALYLASMAGVGANRESGTIGIGTYADSQLELLIQTVEQLDFSGVGEAHHLNTCRACREKFLDLLTWFRSSLQIFEDLATSELSSMDEPLTMEWYQKQGLKFWSAHSLAQKGWTLRDILGKTWDDIRTIHNVGSGSYIRLQEVLKPIRGTLKLPGGSDEES